MIGVMDVISEKRTQSKCGIWKHVGHGHDGLMVGLDELGDLFQTE